MAMFRAVVCLQSSDACNPVPGIFASDLPLSDLPPLLDEDGILNQRNDRRYKVNTIQAEV
jgi:hypothetical protein